MKKLFPLLAFFALSCAPRSTTLATDAPPPPDLFVMDQWHTYSKEACFTLAPGLSFFTDGTTECPREADVKWVVADTIKKHKLQKSMAWENVGIIYTDKYLACNVPYDAMACTVQQETGVGQSYVVVISKRFPWSRSLLRHELTHVSIFIKGGSPFEHLCLDHPDTCADKRMED